MFEGLIYLDGYILLWIQDFIRNPILDKILIFITTLGNAGAVWILLSVLLLLPKKTRKIGVMSLLALLMSLLINNLLLKNLVARIRPYEVLEGLEILIAKPKDYSFPSGHAGASFASAAILYRSLPKRYGIPLIVLAVLIAFSRLYIGVHYVSDVLFGAMIGLSIGYLIHYLGQKKRVKKD